MVMITEILPRLYMSDLYAAESASTHSALGITHVVSVMPGYVQIPKSTAPRQLQIPIRDQPFEELAAHLSSTTSFIAEALNKHRGSVVLVHCVQGMSRSASVVAAYLMAVYGWSVRDAVDFVRTKCSNARPNSGFIGQLQEYYDLLSKSGAR